jgi:hypothetical protein
MDATRDTKAYQANRWLVEGHNFSPKTTTEKGQHFVLPWRLNEGPGDACWQQADDASCGSGPTD